MSEGSESNGKRAALAIAALLSALALAGCGGSSGVATQSTIPCLFSGLAQMIYPIPNATNVPDAVGQVDLATSQLFPATFQALINTDPNPNNAHNGTGVAFVRINQSQVPSPSATLQISNPFFESAQTSANFSHNRYYVFLNDTLGACIPQLAGSFTTI